MIIIGKSNINVDQANGKAFLCADVKIDQSSYQLWFSVDRKWRECLSKGRADAFRKGINLSAAERRVALRKIKKQIGRIKFLKKKQ